VTGPLLGLIVLFLLFFLAWLSSRLCGTRHTPAQPAPRFEDHPVINSHRVKCPQCGYWASLLVNQHGQQRRICDSCGTEDL